MRVSQGNNWNIIFKIQDDLYEWLVMFFSLFNVSSIFMWVMFYIYDFLLGSFLYVYLEYFRHVFIIFRSVQLYVNLNKCLFFQFQVFFLGFIISVQGISADSVNISVIRDWSEFFILTEIRSFYELVLFYSSFIQGFSFFIVFIIKCMNNWNFRWIFSVQSVFLIIK